MKSLGKCAKSVPEEIGNTDTISSSSTEDIKTTNALYKWDFVLNNYNEEEVCQIKQFITTFCKKGGFGYEVGESGTPHLQGFLSLIKKERKSALYKKAGFIRASLRPTRNEEALIEYCKKDKNFWTHGLPKPIKIIENLYDWQKKIEDIFLTEPDDRKVYWFWDENGNIGKTAFIKYMVVKYKCLFCSGGKYQDIMNLVFNQDMDNCRGVFFNIPRANKGHVSYASLEAIKDGLICNTKYETGVKIFNPPHLFVFANFPPDDLYELSLDRWIITNLDGENTNEKI